ncbi:hypothetical protein PAPYR_8013 [Paratrimastix pyriformis]|uniref:BRCT domain-containing protein n=1 Tax=Paratrimastix pyriformis TaxID=342808 RepID=A0ABQ8UFQ9_9EUKA|nr:hypothetical protein PAPYR_8013 [Paratrimastix pyriformis]
MFEGLLFLLRGRGMARDKIQKLVIKNGGRFGSVMCPKVTHVICGSDIDEGLISVANETHVPLVTPDWVVQSVEAGKQLPEVDFAIGGASARPKRTHDADATDVAPAPSATTASPEVEVEQIGRRTRRRTEQKESKVPPPAVRDDDGDDGESDDAMKKDNVTEGAVEEEKPRRRTTRSCAKAAKKSAQPKTAKSEKAEEESAEEEGDEAEEGEEEDEDGEEEEGDTKKKTRKGPARLFGRCCFCFTGAMRLSRNQMGVLVRRHGGRTSERVTQSVLCALLCGCRLADKAIDQKRSSLLLPPPPSRKVTHLICSGWEGQKARQAERYGISIVKDEWIHASIAAGKRLPESDYYFGRATMLAHQVRPGRPVFFFRRAASSATTEGEIEDLPTGTDLFAHLSIHVAGLLRTPHHEALMKLLADNGASVYPTLQRVNKLHYAVLSNQCNPVQAALVHAACASASRLNVVVEQWVYESLRQGKLLDAAAFHPSAYGAGATAGAADDEPPVRSARDVFGPQTGRHATERIALTLGARAHIFCRVALLDLQAHPIFALSTEMLAEILARATAVPHTFRTEFLKSVLDAQTAPSGADTLWNVATLTSTATATPTDGMGPKGQQAISIYDERSTLTWVISPQGYSRLARTCRVRHPARSHLVVPPSFPSAQSSPHQPDNPSMNAGAKGHGRLFSAQSSHYHSFHLAMQVFHAAMVDQAYWVRALRQTFLSFVCRPLARNEA